MEISLARRRLAGKLLALPLIGLAPSAKALAQSRRTRGIIGQAAPELPVDFWIDRNGRPTEFSLLAQRGKWVHLKF